MVGRVQSMDPELNLSELSVYRAEQTPSSDKFVRAQPLSSGLLKCLRRVSTFSSLFILYDSSFNKYPAGLLGFRDAACKPQRLLAPGLQGRRHFPPDGHAAWALVLILFSPPLFISFHVLRH